MIYESNSMLDVMKDVLYTRTIKQIETSLKSSKDLKSAFSTLLDIVVHSAKAEAGTLWFYEKSKDGRIRPFAVYGGKDIGDFSLGLGEGIAGKVIQNSSSIIVEDCMNNPHFSFKTDEKTGFVTKSMIVVPLRNEGEAFGCIQIINKTDDGFFDAKDLVFVEVLAKFSQNKFMELGLVERDTTKPKGAAEVSFSEIVISDREVDMESKLRSVKAFSLLSIVDQKIVLTHMLAIYRVFSKKRHKR